MSTTATKRRPRIYRAEKPLPLTITPRLEELLRLFTTYEILDVYQVMRVMRVCFSMATRYLTNAKHGGFKGKHLIRPMSDLHHFCLDTGGYRYLEGLGCAPEGRFRPDEVANRQPSYIKHSHDCTSLQILADVYNCEHPDSIRRILSDKELHRIPMKVTVKGKSLAVIPDALIDFDLGDNAEHVVLFEIDRGTTNVQAWKDKLLGYLEAIKGEHKRLGTKRIQAIAIIVTDPGIHKLMTRVNSLLSYIEEVLSSAKMQHAASGFKVTAANLDEIDPDQLFTKAIWFEPFGEYQPKKLLGG